MSNTSCANCGARLSCGCQRRQASNGASACTNCLTSLEAKIAVLQQATTTPTKTTIKPQWGANRYKTNQ
jgi:hypothetical protein